MTYRMAVKVKVNLIRKVDHDQFGRVHHDEPFRPSMNGLKPIVYTYSGDVLVKYDTIEELKEIWEMD